MKHKVNLRDDSSPAQKKQKTTTAEHTEQNGQKLEIFTSLEFKSLLKEPETQLHGLNKFSRACANFDSKKKDSIDIVKSYISSSPDCVEIFKCFGAQSSSGMLGAVFQSFICILTRTTGDLKESYGKVGYNISGAIIQSHLQKIYHALGLRQSPRMITATLKLLTMIIMQEKETASEVANNVDFSLRCFKEVLQCNKGKLGYEVRIAYIKFVLSFFMADDAQTTRKILETHGLVLAIFRGLKTDPASIVQLVLTTLKEKAIKNLYVPKTAKAHFFAEPRLLSLIATLFDWNGVSDITLDETMDTAQGYIRNMVYEFLYHACCPFKYGINFKDKDLGIGEKSRNHVLLDFIFQIVPLTSDSLVRNLVVEVLRACPDLLPRFMSDYRLSLEPKDSEIWIRNFNIVKAAYDAQPDVAMALLQVNSTRPGMGEDVEKIPQEKLLKMSIPGIFPPNFSTQILKHCMKSKFLEIRQNSIALMVSLLSKVKTTLNFAAQQENWVRSGYSEDEAETFLLQLQEELLKICVNVGAIVSIWKDISGENVPMLKSLIFQIFCLLQEIFPDAIAEAKFDFTKLLHGIDLSKIAIGDSSAPDSDTLILKMLSKAPAQYKWFRITENKESPFRRLLQIIYATKNSKTGLHREAVMLFKSILSTNNILDAGKLSESQIWINNLLSEVKTHNDTAILNFVADVCGRVARRPVGYNEILSSQERRTSVNVVPKVGNEFWDALPEVEIEPAQKNDFVSNWNGGKELTPVTISDRLEQAPFQSPYPVSLMMTAALDALRSTDSLGSEEKSILDRYLSDVFDSLFHILASAEDAKFFAGVFVAMTTHISDFKLHFPRIHNFLLFLSLWLKKSVAGFTEKKDDLWSFMKGWIWEVRKKEMKSGKLLKKVVLNFAVGNDISASDELLQQALLYFDILSKLRAESQIEEWQVKEIFCVIVYLLQKVDGSSNLGDLINENTDERKNSSMEVDLEPKSDVSTCRVQRSLSWKRFLQTPSVKDLFFEDIHLSANTALDYLTMNVEKLFKGSESLSEICTVITANALKTIYAVTVSPIDGFVTDYVSKVTRSIPVLLHSLFEKHSSTDGKYFLFSVFSNLRSLIPVENLQEIFQKVTDLLENVQSKDAASLFPDFLSDCIRSILSRDVISMSHTAVGALFKFLCNKHVKKSDKLIRDFIKLLDHFPSLAIVAPTDFIKFCLKKLTADKAELFAKVLHYNPSLLPPCDAIRDKLKSVDIKKDFIIFPVLNQILKSSSQMFTSESQVALGYSRDIIDRCRSFVLSEFGMDFDIIFQIMQSNGGTEFLEWHFSALLKFEYCEVDTLVRSLEGLESHCDSDVTEVMTLAEILLKAAKGSGKPNMIAVIFKLITSEADKKGSDTAIAVAYEKLGAILDDLKMEEFVEVRKKSTQIWSKFLKRTLKDHFGNPVAMQCLSKLVPVFYDKSKENSSGLSVSIFRRMLISHSKFLPIFLSEDSEKMSAKARITNLLVELTLRCDAEDLSDKDLGFLLGGYGGTLSQADQNILKIILSYEKKGVNFSDFKPFLWGKAAISSYRARKNMGDTLWKRPGPSEILSCLDATVVKATLARFPLRRRMICASQNIDDLKYFENDFSITMSAADNGIKSSQPSNHGVYDPCFLLPAIFDVLKLGNLVDCKVFVRSGALSILMSGLASHCPVIRASSASCLSLYYQHAQTAWFSENNLTMYIIRCIRNSLEPKNDEAGNLVIPRLSSVVANFFSTLVKLHSTPEDHMFAALHRFLLVKPQFDLKNIPEFYILFFSAEMENKVERTWLLNLISKGLRDMADYHVVKRKNVFRLLMCLHDSPISDNYSRRQVFEILEQVCTIRSAAIDLVKSRGLVPWLMEAATQQPCRNKEPDYVGIAGKRQENTMHIIRVVSTLWKTLNVSNFVAEEIADKEEDGAEGQREKHAALAPFRVVKQIITLAVTLLENLSCMGDSILKGGDSIAGECLGETLVVLESCLTNLDERRKWANTKREDSKESLQDDICDLHTDHVVILLKIASIFVDSCEPQITTSLVTIFTLWAPPIGSKFSAGDHTYKLWTMTLEWTLGPSFAVLGQSSNWVEKKIEKYLKWVENWLSVTDEELERSTKKLVSKCYELACSHSAVLSRNFFACVKTINGILRPGVIVVENEEDHGIFGEMQSIRMSLLLQNE